MKPTAPVRTAAVLALAATVLSGCVIAPPRPYYGDAGGYGAAPPPEREVIGVAPVAGYIWIGGFWNWIGGRHMWVPGRWEAPRHHGHRGR